MVASLDNKTVRLDSPAGLTYTPVRMATSQARIRQGIGIGRSPREELQSLRRLQARAILDEQNILKKARKAGMTWQQIALELGMTESGCRRKYVGRGIE